MTALVQIKYFVSYSNSLINWIYPAFPIPIHLLTSHIQLGAAAFLVRDQCLHVLLSHQGSKLKIRSSVHYNAQFQCYRCFYLLSNAPCMKINQSTNALSSSKAPWKSRIFHCVSPQEYIDYHCTRYRPRFLSKYQMFHLKRILKVLDCIFLPFI